MRTKILAFAFACSLILVAGCGDDDSGGSVDAAAGDGDDGGDGGDGNVDAAVVVPAPQQDPNTNKWMCSDGLGGMHVCACNDGLDNDNDQATDAADVGCAGGPYVDTEVGTGACGTTQCTNCRDDDGDGKVDSADPECTGSLDNSEASYATGIPGDNSDACKQDCFFDGNSGSGNDGCEWNFKCDPLSPGANAARACPYDPNFRNCPGPQSQRCIDFCQKYTPNGCDCFGCCTVFNGTTSADVILTPQCSAGNLANTTACPRCTKVTSCNNTCDPCEFCLGRPPLMTCTPVVNDGGMPVDGGPIIGQCPANIVPCVPSPDGSSCAAGYFCLTGCCIPNIN